MRCAAGNLTSRATHGPLHWKWQPRIETFYVAPPLRSTPRTRWARTQWHALTQHYLPHARTHARANSHANTHATQIAAELAAGGVSSSLCGAIAEAIFAREPGVSKALDRDAAARSHAHLTDFDWSVRLVVSSDKLSSMRQPLTVLKLFVAAPGGGADGMERREVSLELTQQDLERLLAACSDASAAVGQLRA